MGRRKRRIVEDVTLTGIADKGQAVGRDAEGMVYFVKGAVPGDVVDVWRLATDGAEMPEHVLCSVNLEHMPPNTKVKDGDEVAFFPPVTGG